MSTTREDFNEYIINRYGAKGMRSVKFSNLDELDVLLGIKDDKDIDDDDIKFLNVAQLKELEKLKERNSSI